SGLVSVWWSWVPDSAGGRQRALRYVDERRGESADSPRRFPFTASVAHAPVENRPSLIVPHDHTLQPEALGSQSQVEATVRCPARIQVNPVLQLVVAGTRAESHDGVVVHGAGLATTGDLDGTYGHALQRNAENYAVAAERRTDLPCPAMRQHLEGIEALALVDGVRV